MKYQRPREEIRVGSARPPVWLEYVPMIVRSKSMVGLDVGTHAVKAIELTQRGNDVEITGFGQVEVPADDPQARARAVQDLMRECGFRTKKVVTGVSGKQVIIRYLNMVKMSDEELKNAIQFEAEKYVPFPLEDCTMDCQRLDDPDGRHAGGNMTVLLVAAQRSQVEEHLAMLREASVTPIIVDVDAFAVGNAYCLTQEANEAENTDRILAFVDVGARKTNINIIRGATSLFTREIPIGGHDFTEAISRALNVSYEEAEVLKREGGEVEQAVQEAVYPIMDDLGNEIQLSFDYFENQFEREIEAIRLSGGGCRFPGFRGSMEKIFEKTTELFNPFEKIGINAEVDADLLSVNAAQLVVAVGLASRLRKE